MLFKLFKYILRKITGVHDEKLDLEAHARSIGVKIGDNCIIATIKWGACPYLIEIGNHVHIASGVQFLTDRKSTRLNSSHTDISRMPSSA